MQSQLISILALLVFCTYQATQTFGLLTVTHSRQGNYSILEKYLKKYAEEDCYKQFISQINLVWNNQQNPEETVILKNKNNWKIPVHFYKTTFNSMDHRYRLPKQSTAQLLYSLDDDILVDCQTFKLTLKEYNKVGNGKLGRIVTNQVRGFKFQPSASINSQFFYQGQANTHFYTISEPGAALIPRHYLQVYYLKLNELIQLRNEVLDVKNCDDIFFYAFVQHFYPELPAAYVPGQKDYKNTDPKIGQSKTQNVYPKRSKCITDISNALGYNPLRYFGKNSNQLLKNWQYDNLQTILQLKMQGFNEVQQQKAVEKSYQQYFKQKKEKEEKRGQQQKQISQQRARESQMSSMKVKQIKELNEKDKAKIPQKTQNIAPKIEENQNDKSKIQNPGIKNDKINSDKVQIDQKELKEDQQISIKLTFQEELIIYLFFIGLLSIISIKLIKKNCSKKAKYRIRVNEEQESSFSTIRIPERI